MAARKGSQLPTQSMVLPYKRTLGKEAIDLYDSTKRKAQEWQKTQVDNILAINEEGLWTHTKYGYSVPRRNGKSEILMMIMMWAFKQELRVLYTAHRTTTSHSTWEKTCKLLSQTDLREKVDYRTIKQFGLERIEMLHTEAMINFRTRSSKGGLGEGYDILIIDEAQEYTDDQETALKYVVTDSKNPLTILCGTPPTAVSAGTVFTKYRSSVLSGQKEDAGWAEWSVRKMTDVRDVDAWYECNPSLGTILTERAIRSEISEDDIDFNIQRFGLWLRYNQKSAISEKEWLELKVDVLPEFKKAEKLYVGIKYGVDGENVSMSVAAKTADGHIFVECIDCRPTKAGNEWILSFLKNAAAIEKVVVDGTIGQKLLADTMKEVKIHKKLIEPTVKDVIAANTAFVQGLEARIIQHAAQPSLVQSVSNCDKRKIGNNGGYGYKSIKDGVEVALLESVVLAYWLCQGSKEKKKQKARY